MRIIVQFPYYSESQCHKVFDKKAFLTDVTKKIEDYEKTPFDQDIAYTIHSENKAEIKIRMIFNARALITFNASDCGGKILLFSYSLKAKNAAKLIQKVNEIALQNGLGHLKMILSNDSKLITDPVQIYTDEFDSATIHTNETFKKAIDALPEGSEMNQELLWNYKQANLSEELIIQFIAKGIKVNAQLLEKAAKAQWSEALFSALVDKCEQNKNHEIDFCNSRLDAELIQTGQYSDEIILKLIDILPRTIDLRNAIIQKQASDVVLLKLIEVTHKPIEPGCLDYALLHHHSDVVIHKLMDHTESPPYETLDRALCEKASFSVVQRLIAKVKESDLDPHLQIFPEDYFKVGSHLIDRALCQQASENISLAIIQAFDPINQFNPYLVKRAIDEHAAESVISALVDMVDKNAVSHVDHSIIEAARAADYSESLINKLKTISQDPDKFKCAIL